MPKTTSLAELTENHVAPRIAAMRAMFGPMRPATDSNEESLNDREGPARPRIAVIDDQPINIKIVCKYLKLAGYEHFVWTTDSREALALIDREQPDLVFLDIMMPHVSGLDILADLRRSEEHAAMPVIILTAASEKQTKLDALKLGATEFLLKPIDASELEARVRNVLAAKAYHDRIEAHATVLEAEVAARTAELVLAHREIVRCLAAVGEYRDTDTGRHVIRVGRYAEIISEHLGMNREFCDRIREAAPLHDIGKVGLPDSILLKPGKLEDFEFQQMTRHSEYGNAICSRGFHARTPGETVQSHALAGRVIARFGDSPILRMAGIIAYTHHERWDGRGYPRKLKGDAIPLEGRITAVADVFDALTSRRPYKTAFPLDKSLEIIDHQRGVQFDPRCVDAFFAGIERVIAAYHEFADIAVESAGFDAAEPENATPQPFGLGSGSLEPLICALSDSAAVYTYTEQSA